MRFVQNLIISFQIPENTRTPTRTNGKGEVCENLLFIRTCWTRGRRRNGGSESICKLIFLWQDVDALFVGGRPFLSTSASSSYNNSRKKNSVLDKGGSISRIVETIARNSPCSNSSSLQHHSLNNMGVGVGAGVERVRHSCPRSFRQRQTPSPIASWPPSEHCFLVLSLYLFDLICSWSSNRWWFTTSQIFSNLFQDSWRDSALQNTLRVVVSCIINVR